VADNTFGQAIFRLLIEDKEFRAAFSQAVQTAQVSTKKIGDLTNVKLKAPDMADIERKLEAGTAKLQDFGLTATKASQSFGEGFRQGVRQGLADVRKEFEATGQTFTTHGQSVDNLSQRYRQFFREQRLQDRIVGEGRQSIMALASGMSFLAAGTAQQAGETNNLNVAMLQGIGTMQGVEFLLFSVGNIANRTTGAMSRLAATLGSLATPISIAVAAGVFFISMLRETNDEANAAVTEGLAKLDNLLERLNEEQRVKLLVDVEGLKSDLDRALASVNPEKILTLNATFKAEAPEQAAKTIGAVNEQLAKKLDLERQSESANTSLLQTISATHGALEANKDALDANRALTAQAVTDNTAITTFNELQLKSIQEQSDKLGLVLDKLKKKVDAESESVATSRLIVRSLASSSDEYVKQEARLLFITESLKRNRDLLTDEMLTQTQITALIDERERIERERAARTKSSLDMAKADVEIAQKKFELGKGTEAQVQAALEKRLEIATKQKDETEILQAQLDLQKLASQAIRDKLTLLELEHSLGVVTTQELLNGLNAAKASAPTRLERLQIEEKIRSILKAQTDELTAQAEKFRQQNLERIKRLEESRINLVTNRFDREKVLEERRFAEETRELQERLAFVGALDEEQQEQRKRDIETLANLRLAHERNLQDIEKRRIDAMNEIKLAAIGTEQDAAIARIDERYRLLEQRATETFANEQERAIVIAELRKRKEQEVQFYLNGIAAEGINRIASALSALGDEGISKFARMLQIAVQIAQTLERANLGLEGGDPLSVIASFLPILGLFEEGGEIPGGSYVVNAEQSRRHAAILDSVGAMEVSGGIPGRDSVPLRIRGTDGVALLAPGERVVAPRYAFLGKAINEGKVTFRAGGGSIGGLVATFREFKNAGGSSLPLTAEFVAEVRRMVTGDRTLDVLNAIADRMQELNERVQTVAEETAMVRQEVGKPLRGEVEFIDGKMFLRKELSEALDFERERSS
jgi:hypothetical protein